MEDATDDDDDDDDDDDEDLSEWTSTRSHFLFLFLSLPWFSCLSCLIFMLALVGASLFLLPTLFSLPIVMTNLLFPKCVFMTQIRRVA